MDGAVVTTQNLTGGLKSAAQKEGRVDAKLTIGEYSTDISGRHNFPAVAAAQVAEKIQKWVKDNVARVIAMRK